MRKLPPDTVRGRVRGWVERHADKLGDDVLEIGSRLHLDGAWWLVNRDLAKGNWYGIDMQEGRGVDQVADIHRLADDWGDRFTGVLCSEVLEHVKRPWVALPELSRVLRPGGWIVVTTLTAFPIHGFPDDYYRYTESGLRLLLEDAGFVDVETASAGAFAVTLNDHGAGIAKRDIPIHVFSIGRKPC